MGKRALLKNFTRKPTEEKDRTVFWPAAEKRKEGNSHGFCIKWGEKKRKINTTGPFKRKKDGFKGKSIEGETSERKKIPRTSARGGGGGVERLEGFYKPATSSLE